MCLGSSSSPTPTPTVQREVAVRPDEANANVESAKLNAQKRALAAKGSEENNITGGLGGTNPALKKKSLLGATK